MERITLGKTEISIPRIGLGCMGMAFAYGKSDPEECRATLSAALDLGVNFFDTSDMYGMGGNERFIGQFMKGRRDEVVLATKCGIVVKDDPRNQSLNTTPEYIVSACEASLERLRTDVIDLFYLHRLDGVTPLEDSMGALADLHGAGKIKAAGISEVSADTIRQANQTFAVSAVQNEYSLMSRDPEIEEAIDACAEIGATFVPYSPICRGLLTGEYRDASAFGNGDYRSVLPRFQADRLSQNVALVDQISAMAHERGASPAQLSIAWVLSRGTHVVPIPGTRKVERLTENFGAGNIVLTESERHALSKAVPIEAVVGGRYTSSNSRGLA